MRHLILILLVGVLLPSLVLAKDGPLKVGLAARDLTPESNIPLGGYGSGVRRNWPFKWFKYPHVRFFRAAQGKLDPIRAKVMFLTKNGQKLLFISLDVVAVSEDLPKDLLSLLAPMGFSSNEVFVSATHTHSGPGALSKNHFWQVFAMDRFNPRYYRWFLSSIAEAVKEAQRVAAPAQLYRHNFTTSALIRSRRKGPIDPTARTLFARSLTGEWLGGMINFPVHGISLDEDNMLFSADTPGAIERETEGLLGTKNSTVSNVPPVVLFINAAEGDVSPNHYGIEGMKTMGESFAAQLEANWEENQSVADEDWSVSKKTVQMGRPRVRLKKCLNKKWVPEKMNIGMRAYFPSTANIWQIKLGDMVMMSWPGEATVRLGQQLFQKALDAGYKVPWFLGLTNDHRAYFTTPSEFDDGGMETCVNLYGPHGGEKIINAHEELLNSKDEL